MWRFAFVVMVGCGRLAFDPRTESDDGGLGDGASDIAFPATCQPFQAGWSLEPAVPEPSLASPFNIVKPFLTADGLTLFYISDADGSEDVWSARRTSRGAPFTTPERYNALSADTFDETGVSLADDLTAMITSNRVGSANQDLWQSTWNATSGVHGVPVLVTGGANTGSWEYEPTITPDGNRIYYVTENYTGFPGGGDPVFSDRTGPTSFGPPTLVAELASMNNEYGFTMSRDGLVAMVASDREGPGTVSYIYVATRASTSVAFPAPQRLPQLDVSTDQGHGMISADGCEIWFAALTGAVYQLYVARWHEQ